MTGLRRLTVTMTEGEREALDRLARQDLRPVKSQIRWLVTQEAQRRGLLDATKTAAAPAIGTK